MDHRRGWVRSDLHIKPIRERTAEMEGTQRRDKTQLTGIPEVETLQKGQGIFLKI